jgi:hypothetical protein
VRKQFKIINPERTGLTADQTTAVLSVLTDGKRVSVINAPAGSVKTRVMTEAARGWAAAGWPVLGITPSQSARPARSPQPAGWRAWDLCGSPVRFKHRSGQPRYGLARPARKCPQ